MSTNELELEIQQVIQNWQNGLQNIGEVDQLRRFVSEVEGQFGHYLRVLVDKKDILNKRYNKAYENTQKYEELYGDLVNNIQQNNAQDDKFMTECFQEIGKNEKRFLNSQNEIFKIDFLNLELIQKRSAVIQQANGILQNLPEPQQNIVQQQGLTPRSIRRFHLFSADETLVGEECAICLENINIGRRMRRLTCDGQHAFCPGCCETWFANNNTCPLCRHAFV